MGKGPYFVEAAVSESGVILQKSWHCNLVQVDDRTVHLKLMTLQYETERTEKNVKFVIQCYPHSRLY